MLLLSSTNLPKTSPLTTPQSPLLAPKRLELVPDYSICKELAKDFESQDMLRVGLDLQEEVDEEKEDNL
jgi:hypothetical protein